MYELSVSSAGKYAITADPEDGYDLLLSVRGACPGNSQQCLAGANTGAAGDVETVEVVLQDDFHRLYITSGSSIRTRQTLL